MNDAGMLSFDTGIGGTPGLLAGQALDRGGLSKEATVRSEHGLHARSAVKIVLKAQRARADIWIKSGDRVADGKSVIDILTLGCGNGKRITVKADDLADSHILDAIVNMIEGGFDGNA